MKKRTKAKQTMGWAIVKDGVLTMFTSDRKWALSWMERFPEHVTRAVLMPLPPKRRKRR